MADCTPPSSPALDAYVGYHLRKAHNQALRRLDLALGKLQTGDSLPSERVLAEQLGISRSTARRYLEYLLESTELMVDQNYGAIGRPELAEDPRLARNDGRAQHVDRAQRFAAC